MENKKIKIAWICGFNNKTIHNKLKPRYGFIERLIRKATHRSTLYEFRELSQWVTNGIQEFEKFTEEVELHILAPYSHISDQLVEFELNGIYYHFVKNEFNSLLTTITRKVRHKVFFGDFKENRKLYAQILKKIHPDVVHVIGAECPNYSLALLDIPSNIPTIAQLQTLMSDPAFEKNYCIEHETYSYRATKEKEVIKSASYVGTKVVHIAKMVKDFAPDARIINTTLALTEPVDLSESPKEFDFVYFSKEVEKAGDYAVEAYIRAFLMHPGITLDIVGACSESYKLELLELISKVGATDYVTFEGALPTHADVIKQIRKSRFAVIPMKIDMLAGTVRECMANGIPVCTTITPVSPNENAKRESLLLSEKGDYQKMAENMCKLINNPEFADMIRNNAAQTFEERGSNESIMRHWVEIYKAIIQCQKDGKELPSTFLTEA